VCGVPASAGVDGGAAATAVSVWRRLAIAPFVAVIKLYQFTLSPVFGRHCRFHPTCSWYALEAYRTHGAVRGTLLTGWRIVRCNPFGKGGLDPVPPARP
jgi:putative membrane protein insertion efficiency factor